MRMGVLCRCLLDLAPGAPAPAALALESNSALPGKQGGAHQGGELARFDGSVRLGSDAVGLGREVNLEDAVGPDAATRHVRRGGYWRFGETSRHEAKPDSLPLQPHREPHPPARRHGERHDVPGWNGGLAGLVVQDLRATYGHSFLLDERTDLSATAGLDTLPFRLDCGSISSNESQHFTAPLPVLGLHGDSALTPGLCRKQGVDLSSLGHGDSRVSLTEVDLGVAWYPWERLGPGRGSESLRIAIEAHGQEIGLEGNVKDGQNGVSLGIA
jgi:hypothetical protein